MMLARTEVDLFQVDPCLAPMKDFLESLGLKRLRREDNFPAKTTFYKLSY